ncbi:MAG: glycerate kinase [Halofilum sp. (in: g-proteobacteria)]
MKQPRDLLVDLFTRAVEAAQPERHVGAHLPDPPRGRTVVVGAGKAAAGMARAVERARGAGADLTGAVAVPHGTPCECAAIECIEAGHPVPDEGSLRAAKRLRTLVADLGADDQVIALFSGGGSALLCDPVPGLTLAAKQALSQQLLRSGASIHEINCVRQALSMIKGGRLAALAAPAPVHTLLISDVAGDDPAAIASGPTVSATCTATDAMEVLRRYELEVPAVLTRARAGPNSGLGSNSVQVICSPVQSLEAAAEAARGHGLEPLVLGDGLEGAATEMANVHAGIARSSARWGLPVEPPAVLLSGGEATVAMAEGGGRGGPNAEFALALAYALNGHKRVHAIACDTDGIDGSEHNAGAVIDPTTLARAREAGLYALDHLSRHDSFAFFDALGDLVVTGPPRTNVNDFRAILIG